MKDITVSLDKVTSSCSGSPLTLIDEPITLAGRVQYCHRNG